MSVWSKELQGRHGSLIRRRPANLGLWSGLGHPPDLHQAGAASERTGSCRGEISVIIFPSNVTIYSYAAKFILSFCVYPSYGGWIKAPFVGVHLCEGSRKHSGFVGVGGAPDCPTCPGDVALCSQFSSGWQHGPSDLCCMSYLTYSAEFTYTVNQSSVVSGPDGAVSDLVKFNYSSTHLRFFCCYWTKVKFLLLASQNMKILQLAVLEHLFVKVC